VDRSAWQEHFDHQYPDGAVCTWKQPGEAWPVTYRVSWIYVLRMAGDDPVVLLYLLSVSRTLGPECITSYVPAEDARWPPGTHLATFGIAPDPMYFNPRVPPAMHWPMAVRRREYLMKHMGDSDQGPGFLDVDAGGDGGVPAPAQGPAA
jgi:hypothetical protein